jgi:nitrogen regulatory protein PII
MECKLELLDIELIWGIVDEGFGYKLVMASKDCGVGGRTILPGRRIVEKRPLLDLFGLADEKRDVVLMLADSNRVKETFRKLITRFEEEEGEPGLVFTTGVTKVIGTRNCIGSPQNFSISEDEKMYSLMTVVVERGKAERAVEIANKMGAVCVTIINGRGAGVHETSKVFAMEIEPEKEIVLIVVDKGRADDIVAAVRDQLQLEKPGNGLVFIQEINRIYGA